jgi:hypothetical protein
MTVIDLGKNMGQYGVQVSELSPRQLLAEAMEGIREVLKDIEKPVDGILVSERVYRAMVDRLEEWTPEGDLVPHSPDVVLNGIRVYVCKDELDRFELRWRLWEEGKKILEVVE